MNTTLLVATLAGLLAVAGSAHGIELNGGSGQFQVVEGPGSSAPFMCDGPAACGGGFTGVGYQVLVNEATNDVFVCLFVGAGAYQYGPTVTNTGSAFDVVCLFAQSGSTAAGVSQNGNDNAGSSTAGVAPSNGFGFTNLLVSGASSSVGTSGNELSSTPLATNWNLSGSTAYALGSNCLGGNANILFVGVTVTPPCL